MIFLYDAKETDFSYNGIPLPDAEEVMVEETLNGDFFVNITYPISKNQRYKLLEVDKIITVKTPRSMQAFRIVEINKGKDVIELFAHHVFFDLNRKVVETYGVDRVFSQTALDELFNRIKSTTPFTWRGHINERHTLNYDEPLSATAVLLDGKHSILGLWDGELLRNNFTIEIKKRIGTFNGAVLSAVSNITDFSNKIDFKDVVTRVIAVSKFSETVDGKNVDRELRVVVDSNLAGRYSTIREARYENNNLKTEKELRDWAKLKFTTDNIDKPKATLEIDAARLDGGIVSLGDEALVKIEQHNIDVVFKCTSYKYDALEDEYITVGFGGYSSSFSSGMSNYVSGNSVSAETVKRIVGTNVDKWAEQQSRNFDRYMEQERSKIEQSVTDGIAQATAQVEIIRAETDAKLRDNLRQFEKQVSDISTHFNDTIGQYGTVIEENQTKIEQTTNELTGIRQSVANLSGDILKKSELEITPDRITFGAGKVVDGRTIASLVSVSPEATNIISDTVTITGNQYNLVFKNKRETFKSSIKGIDATPKYNVPLTENDAFLLEGDYSADIPINLTAVLWLFLDTGKAINVRLTNLTKGSNGSFSKEFRVIKTIRPIVGFNFAMYQEQNPLTEYTINNFRIVRKTTSNLLVDGSITAQKIAAGSIETPHLKAGSVTAEILSANAVTADKLKVDTAMANKLSANDALINNLVSKNAFINKVKSIDIDAARITSGVLRSTNGATQFNLNNGSLKFYTDSPAISRELAGYPTQFIKLTTGNHTTQGKTIPIGVTVIGSNRWGTGNSNDGGFVGVRLWNGQKDGVTLDEVDVVGDRVSLLAAANTNPSGWNIDTWVNKEGKRVIDMVNASDRPGSLLRIGNVHLFHKSGNTYSDLVDILRNIRQNILLLHNHKEGSSYSYDIYNI